MSGDLAAAITALRDALTAHGEALRLYGCGYHPVTDTTMQAVEEARRRLKAVLGRDERRRFAAIMAGTDDKDDEEAT